VLFSNPGEHRAVADKNSRGGEQDDQADSRHGPQEPQRGGGTPGRAEGALLALNRQSIIHFVEAEQELIPLPTLVMNREHMGDKPNFSSEETSSSLSRLEA